VQWCGLLSRMPLQGFSHVGICVSDLDRSVRFYREVFGFAQLYALDFSADEVAATMEQSGAFKSAMLLRGDVRVELLQWVDVPTTGTGERKSMTALGFTHLSFRVEGIHDLSELVRTHGGAVLEHTLTTLGEGPGATQLLYLLDPDGTRIEVMSGVPDLSGLTPADVEALTASADPAS
jgi:glyoxylase I family protein